MKKLLGIVVLGLGLTFNVNANAGGEIKIISDTDPKTFIIKQNRPISFEGVKNLASSHCLKSQSEIKDWNLKSEVNSEQAWLTKSITYTFSCSKPKIAKTEPSQTQKEALNRLEVQKETLKVISGYTTDGNYFEFHMQKQKVKELVKIHGYFDYKQVMDNYYMTEFSKKKVVANDSYTNFANRLGKTFGGERKFYKRYKKEISESEKNCSCEDPIYKTFLLDLETGHAYKVYHPQSNKPKLSGDFRLKKNIGKKALLKTGKIIQDIENAVGMDTIDLLLNGYMIYSAIENPQGVFKKNKGSSSTSSSTVTKSLGSGSGSVLDREFGGQSLKRLIAISRR